MSLISWNCRGVGGPRAVRSIRDVVNTHRPSILGLVETKKADGDWEAIRCRLGFKGCFAVRSRGKSGGLAILWSEDVDVILQSFSHQHIDVFVKGEMEFWLTLFYGNPRVQDRYIGWELLRKLRRSEQQAWVVMGDFNEVAFSWETDSRRERQAWQMNNFRECLTFCGLTDLGFKGDKYTYSNRRIGVREVRARLDRAVANRAWREMFPDAGVRHIFANSSDHIPILLSTVEKRRATKKRILRFEPMWIRHGDFKETVKNFWNAQPTGCPTTERLRFCMQQLHKWSGATFGSVKRRIDKLKGKIQELRSLPRNEETTLEEARLSDELDEELEREEIWWRQRSRTEWLKAGDRNTPFFHAKASQRRKANHIEGLRDASGEFCSTENEITTIITDYFSHIFQSQVSLQEDKWNEALDMIPRIVSDEMNTMLTAPFTAAEIKRALFQMHPTKAPGLDGFPALFYQSNWDTVGREIINEALKCLNEGILDVAINETLIVLIPKVKKVERVEDLRPISLCNVTMKIITKAIANRLKIILPSIISQNQSAFIQGRLITDNILVAHEISHFIQSRSRQKTGYLSLKLDLSKAYDRVEWKFLEKLMQKMGFAEEWIKKVMLCISTVTYKIRINENITEIVRPERGLRQGDPISPYLFLLCAEWLTYKVNNYQRLGLVEGIKISREAPVVSHLMFADDCLIFCKASKEAMMHIKNILADYEAIAGQKVNFNKSEMVCSKNISEDLVSELAEVIQVRRVQAHSKYLGLPLIFGQQKKIMFKAIEEKILRKIVDWKTKILSRAGREVLIKAVIQAIPLYAMSCFKVPTTLCKKIASYILGFWWQNGSSHSRGIHWLKADILFLEKQLGGLGFRKLNLMNMAMLAKQGWRILTEPSLLVSKIFKSKYFPNADLFSAVKGARPSYAWRGIFEALKILRFGVWWSESENKYRWKGESSGVFTVKSAYKMALKVHSLEENTEVGQSNTRETQGFWKNLWSLKVPARVKIFVWRLYYDCLPTTRNLLIRGCEVIDKCYLCDRPGENAIHVFKNCWWTRSLFNCFDIPATVWCNLCDSPGYWLWLAAKTCTEEQFRTLVCGLWLGWKARNDIVHGKRGLSIVSLQLKLKFLLKEFSGNSKLQEALQEDVILRSKIPTFLCDGAFDPELGRAGFGVAILKEGQVALVRAGWEECFSSVLEAECRAILAALEAAEEQQLETAVFCTDSREALWALNLAIWKDGVSLRWIDRCLQLLDDHPHWQIRGISRRQNSVADWLARKARANKWSWTLGQEIPSDLPVILTS
ncbi:unnamed protein product [Rhodiola kirilowii]